MSKRILIAFGGNSPEHEVSVISAMQAAAALKENDNQLIPLYLTKEGLWLTGSHLLELESFKELDELKKKSASCTFAFDQYGRAVLKELTPKGLFGNKFDEHPIDVVLCAFHGSEGENGAFQGLCEQFYLPYTGSGVLASAIGMNKNMAKSIAQSVEVPTVKGVLFNENQWVREREETLERLKLLGYPMILKPQSLGSSIGIFKIHSDQELQSAIEQAFQYDFELLAEQLITPLTEINCSVLSTENGYQCSVCEQPKGSDEVLTFDDKYLSESSSKGMASAQRIIPAPISASLTKKIQDYSLKLAHAMDLGGVARLDFLIKSDSEKVFFNEVNTIPGSFSFYLWKHNGLNFSELLEELIKDALNRNARKTGRMRHYETNLLSKRASSGIKGLKSKA